MIIQLRTFFHVHRSMVMIWIAYGMLVVGGAMVVVPIYPELLKLGG